jgi:hypothetical protein
MKTRAPVVIPVTALRAADWRAGIRWSHPIHVSPKVEPTYTEDDILPASAYRILGWPAHLIPQAAKDRDHTYRACIAEYGAATCPCGAYAFTWPTEDAE